LEEEEVVVVVEHLDSSLEEEEEEEGRRYCMRGEPFEFVGHHVEEWAEGEGQEQGVWNEVVEAEDF
jgi:hypothetical protein